MIYIILSLWVLFLAILFFHFKEEQRKYLWYAACLSVWFIIGFRGYHTGPDTIGYVRGFEHVSAIDWKFVAENFEKDTGFCFLSKALSYISSSPVWFLSAMAFLACIGVFDYIGRNTKNPVLALFFFITLGNFMFLLTGMRQAVAMSLCLLSLRFVEKKNLLLFAVLVLLGAACHKSAFVFLPTYFFVQRKITALNMFFNFLGIMLCVLFYTSLLSHVNELLEYDYGVEELSNGYVYYAILLLVMMLSFFTKDRRIYDEKNTINTNLAVVATGMWSIRLFSRTIERPSMYWLTAIPVILTNALEDLRGTRWYFFFNALYILIAWVLFARRTIGLEYHFYWTYVQ